MFRKIIIILAVPIIAASISCTPKEVDPIQEKIKTTISELRGNVAETIIDLDKAEEITLTPAFTLSDEHLEDSGMFFADISSVHYADGTYYVVDAKQHTIFKFNQQLEHIGNIGQYGRGPVDFQQPGDIIKLHDLYFIADNGNLRIQVLDEDFNVITAIQDITFVTFYPHVSVSNKYLGILNYAPTLDHSLIFYLHDDYKEVYQLLMPTILDPGEMPMSLNLVQFSMNRNSDIAAAYNALPHVFVYGTNFEVTHFITFSGLGAIDNNGDYLILSEASTDAQPMTRNRVMSLQIDDSKNLYFINRAEDFVYFINNDSGLYNASFKLRLKELSQNPVMLVFITGEHLAVVDKRNANRVHFYDLYQP